MPHVNEPTMNGVHTPESSEPETLSVNKKTRAKKTTVTKVKKTPKKPTVVSKSEDKVVGKVAEPKEKKSRRVPNHKETLTKRQGLNIATSRINNVINVYALNIEEEAALSEIRNALPRTDVTEVKDPKTGEVSKVETKVKLVPLTSLSERTRTVLANAKQEYSNQRMEEYIKEKLKAIKTANHKAYDKYLLLKKKDLEKKKEKFNLETFNKSFDSQFYKEYTLYKPTLADMTEHKRALHLISKCRTRLSSDLKIYISAFMELMVNQLAKNALYNCFAHDKKKTLSVKHAISARTGDFENEFPLFNLLKLLDVYKRAVESNVEKTSTETSDESVELESKNTQANPYNFVYHCGEICREVRIQMAKDCAKNDNGEPLYDYDYAIVSNALRQFCSDVVTELTVKLSNMMKVQIDDKGAKTIKLKTAENTVKQLHVLLNIEQEPTFNFIKERVDRYVQFRVESKANRTNTGGFPASKTTQQNGYED